MRLKARLMQVTLKECLCAVCMKKKEGIEFLKMEVCSRCMKELQRISAIQLGMAEGAYFELKLEDEKHQQYKGERAFEAPIPSRGPSLPPSDVE